LKTPKEQLTLAISSLYPPRTIKSSLLTSASSKDRLAILLRSPTIAGCLQERSRANRLFLCVRLLLVPCVRTCQTHQPIRAHCLETRRRLLPEFTTNDRSDGGRLSLVWYPDRDAKIRWRQIYPIHDPDKQKCAERYDIASRLIRRKPLVGHERWPCSQLQRQSHAISTGDWPHRCHH
jgi:hypothetical protein